MPFPDGMLTRVVSFPTFVDLEGLPVKATIRVFSSRPLVWAATGQTVLRDAELVMHETGVQMTLPTTDQAGVTDGAGNIVTGWTYTVAYQLAKGGPIPDTVFTLPIEDSSPVVITRDVSGLVSGGVVNVPYPVEGTPGPPGAPGVVQSIVAGANVSVNNADPANPIVSATGGGGGAAAWGAITGTLSSQTDLQTALNGKQPSGSYSTVGHTHPQSDVTNLVTDLAAKAPLASPAFTGTPTGITKSHVGLSNVDNTSDANKPVSTAQQTALNLKADLNSPALTGNPTAPTPTAGDNDTSIATTAFVATSFAPLASPVLTGNPTAPTPTAGDNDTSIATTAFVQTAKVDATVAEFIRDTMGTALVAGTNVTITPNDGADTITISASGGGGGGGVPEPQYATGFYYGPTHILNGTHDAFTTANLTAYWMMFKVGESTPFDRMAVTVGNTPVAGNNLRLGIYNSARLRPTSLVLDAGVVDTTSGGQKITTISQTLAVGVYWICMVAGSSTLQIRATTSGGVRTWNQGHTAADWWEDGACFRTTASSVATALPGTASLTGFNPGSGVSNDIPWITLRAA